MDKFNEPPQFFEQDVKYKNIHTGAVVECVYSGAKHAVLLHDDFEEFISHFYLSNYRVYVPPQTITGFVPVYNTPQGLQFGTLKTKILDAQESAAHYCNMIEPGKWFLLDIITVSFTAPSEQS